MKKIIALLPIMALSTAAQADTVVNKIVSYEQKAQAARPWA